MAYLFECWTCDKTFPAGWKARDQHCEATGHKVPPYECDTCARWFNSENARVQHMYDKNHFMYECEYSGCYETWPTEKDAKNHEVEEHLYCRDCDRDFMSANSLKMHLRSRAHVGQDIKCPFCGKAFTTATGVTHHLEGNCCPSAKHVNRDTLYKFVSSRDRNGVVTQKLIGYHGTQQYEATNRAWNGQSYECYLCHRGFKALKDLNQHLNSPVHQQSLYHCPNRRCRQEFKSLAAIINHLESESCGCTRFEKVQQGIGMMLYSGRMITL